MADDILDEVRTRYATAAPGQPATSVHQGLADQLRTYDINAYAASVQVYALKGAAR